MRELKQQRQRMTLSTETIMKLFKYWPPFWAAGISVKEYDFKRGYIVSQMKISSWNKNYFGTMFGGSLYSMCDPFYVFILVNRLGKGYVVWDIEAKINFLKATSQTVTARFEISNARINEIREEADNGNIVKPKFETQILDGEGAIIAKVSKILYIKKKKG